MAHQRPAQVPVTPSVLVRTHRAASAMPARAGSRGHELEDAQSFADWEVDFLKYDNCWAPPADWVVDRYTAMRDALNRTGRPILYSMCDWGVGDPGSGLPRWPAPAKLQSYLLDALC